MSLCDLLGIEQVETPEDEVEVVTPLGKKLWYINEIRYEKPEK